MPLRFHPSRVWMDCRSIYQVIVRKGRYLPDNEIGLSSSIQPYPRMNGSNWLKKTDRRVFCFRCSLSFSDGVCFLDGMKLSSEESYLLYLDHAEEVTVWVF
jgi:hypothetical protein